MLHSQFLNTTSNISVLLVDDEIKLLEALSKYLECQGIFVLTAESPQIALEILKTHIPDILIVDLIMPFETGYEFITKLKENQRFLGIPFIFLTAKGMVKDRIEGYRLGCRAYISKPFDPEELIIVIKNIIIETKDINNIRQIRNEIKRIRFLLENKNQNYVQFTPREKIILLEILEGKNNQEIGEKMEVSTRNVEKYVTRLLNKTNTKNRTELLKHSYKFYKNLRANDENRTRE
nr:TctD-like protein [Rhodomonas sp. NIES-2332]